MESVTEGSTSEAREKMKKVKNPGEFVKLRAPLRARASREVKIRGISRKIMSHLGGRGGGEQKEASRGAAQEARKRTGFGSGGD